MQSLLSVVIDDTNVHRLCVKIDTAIQFVLLVVKVHRVLPWASGLEPRTYGLGQQTADTSYGIDRNGTGSLAQART